MHYIKVSVLQEIVLDTIRKVCGFVRESEGEFSLPNDNADEPEAYDPVEHQRAIYRKSYYKHRDEILDKTRAKREVIKAAKLAAMPVKTPFMQNHRAFLSFLQYSKAYLPISVTLSGILILAMPE
jgi:hypothetical protein